MNATPVGTSPNAGASPLPDGYLFHGGGLVYDLVYNPPHTKLLADAARAGCRTIGGLDMLVAQAQAQFEWWTGQRPADRVMRDAALARLQRLDARHRSRRQRRGSTVKQTTFDEFVDLAKRATFVPVVKELVADLLTPVSAFLKVAEHSDYAFLLESVEGGEHVGRYSFLGKDPFLILRGRNGQTVMERAGVTTDAEKPFVETLRELMNSFQSPFVPGLPRFTGGAVGYFGYETAAWFEPTAARAGAGAPIGR